MIYVDLKEPWGSRSDMTRERYQRRTGIDKPWLNLSRLGRYPSYVKIRPENGSALKIDGWREPTVHRAYVLKIEPDSEDFQYLQTGSYREYRGSCFCPHVAFQYFGMAGAGHYPIDHLGMSNRARTECLAKANRAEFQFGVAVAELATTVSHLGRTLTDLKRYMQSALRFLRSHKKYIRQQIGRILRTPATRSGRRFLVKTMGQSAANRWLEYQYGWKPLLSDIYGLAGAIDDQINQPKTVKSIANPEERVSPSVYFDPPSGAVVLKDNTIVNTGAKCRMDFLISNSVAATFNRMGLVNILEIGWELIPFSFVLDWILPCGKYLAALSGSWGLTYRGGSITAYTYAESRIEWCHVLPSKVIKPNGFTAKSVTTFRYPVSDVTPRLYIRNPINSVSRAVTALALLITVLSKKG